MRSTLDHIDLALLEVLQRDASLSQRQLADKVGLSQNACWRRLHRLHELGVIVGSKASLSRPLLGLDLVVFTLIRTPRHSAEWLAQFRRQVSSIPEVVDFFRISGDYDYMLKIVTENMASYDSVYRRLISEVELDAVTSYFGMEAIEEQRPYAFANRPASGTRRL